MYILLYLKCITNKDLLYDRELCSIFCNNLNEGRTLKIMDIYIYIYISESLCHTPEINNIANQQYLHLFSCIQLFATPWTAACQASLSLSPGVFLDSCPCPLLISLSPWSVRAPTLFICTSLQIHLKRKPTEIYLLTVNPPHSPSHGLNPNHTQCLRNHQH